MRNRNWGAAMVTCAAVLVIAAGCGPSAPAATPSAPRGPTPTIPPPVLEAKVMGGVSLSPRSAAPADFTAFFEKAKEAGEAVTWAGAWQELATEGSAPHVVAGLASRYGYTPVIIAQFFAQDTGRLLLPLDGKTRQMYTERAAAFAEKYKPRYIGFGIEVNMLWEKSPADFEAFVTLFSDVYDAVKVKSPATQVFTVFQLEKMKGLGGGLFGGVNDPARSGWALLDRFPKADLIAFTTYPGLIYKDPSEILVDYYTDILARTQKPIAFTEIGWDASGSIPGWESSEVEQAAFLGRFLALTRDVKPVLVVWSFLYDQKTPPPFNAMGLLRPDGTTRPAWDEWVGQR